MQAVSSADMVSAGRELWTPEGGALLPTGTVWAQWLLAAAHVFGAEQT